MYLTLEKNNGVKPNYKLLRHMIINIKNTNCKTYWGLLNKCVVFDIVMSCVWYIFIMSTAKQFLCVLHLIIIFIMSSRRGSLIDNSSFKEFPFPRLLDASNTILILVVSLSSWITVWRGRNIASSTLSLQLCSRGVHGCACDSAPAARRGHYVSDAWVMSGASGSSRSGTDLGRDGASSSDISVWEKNQTLKNLNRIQKY